MWHTTNCCPNFLNSGLGGIELYRAMLSYDDDVVSVSEIALTKVSSYLMIGDCDRPRYVNMIYQQQLHKHGKSKRNFRLNSPYWQLFEDRNIDFVSEKCKIINIMKKEKRGNFRVYWFSSKCNLALTRDVPEAIIFCRMEIILDFLLRVKDLRNQKNYIL